jgi:hypothetical protein
LNEAKPLDAIAPIDVRMKGQMERPAENAPDLLVIPTKFLRVHICFIQ